MKIDMTQGPSVSGITLIRLEDFLDVNAESLGDALDHQDRRVALSSLDTAQVGLLNVRATGVPFLRKILLQYVHRSYVFPSQLCWYTNLN